MALGTSLEFRYDLSTGGWSLRGRSGKLAWQFDASALVDLVRPDGQAEQRNIASASLVSCREEGSPETALRRFLIWRAWPDGLAACQRFTFWRDLSDFEAGLSVRAPRYFRQALRSLTPLARPEAMERNLRFGPGPGENRASPRSPTSAPGSQSPAPNPQSLPWRVLDLGWSAAEPARVVPLGAGADVVATGLAVLGSADQLFCLTLGFLEASQAVGQYRFAGGDSLDLGLDSSAEFGTLDLRGAEVASGPLWLSLARIEDALPRFADSWRACHPSRGQPPVLVQWLAGRPSGPESTETEVLDQLGTAASWSGAAALDVATIGPGWERNRGDWSADPLRFPHGLPALRDAIHGQELRAGIQLSPLLVSRSSELFHQHPTWVVRSPTGDPVAVGEDTPDLFALDLSQPAVVAWLGTLGRRIRDDWGFDLAQVACLELDVVSGWRSNGSESGLGAYRQGLRALRESLGEGLLLASGAPLFASLNAADGLLTDNGPVRRADPSPLLRAFLSRVGSLTGPGPIWLDLDGQTLDEARAAATIACFGGGLVTLAGDLGALPPERAELLRACLPPYDGGPVLPIDPFAPEGPCLFACPVRRDGEEYVVLVALNPAEVPVARIVPLATLGLQPGRYHAFEFWSQTYLGVLTERLTLERIPAGGSAVVAVRPVRDEPQVVGTSLHASLGAVALQEAVFNRKAGRLHLAIGAAGDRQGTISIALPRSWTPGPIRGTGGVFTTRQTIEQVVQVEARFKDVADLELEFWQNGAPQR